MAKKAGTYLGGSTVLTSTGHGFSNDPAAKKQVPRDAHQNEPSYTAPPFTAAEEAENDRLRAKMMGAPGLITKEQMDKIKRRKSKYANRT